MDDMRSVFETAFRGVEPPQEVREKILAFDSAGTGTRPRFTRRLPAAMLAAVLAVFLMGAGVAAVVYGDSIQSWFSHYWEMVTGQEMSDGQTALIDHLSQEIGISRTIGDVMVTVDSATVGDDSFFLLLRVEGIDFSSRHSYGFDDISMEISPDPLDETGAIRGFGLQYHGIDGDGAALLLAEHVYATQNGYIEDTRPLEITMVLSDLMRSAHTDREKLLAEGEWSFTFTLDRSQLPAVVRLPDTEILVMDRTQREEHTEVPAMLTGIELTNTGLRFQYDFKEGTLSLDPHIEVVLKNGLTVGCSGGSGYRMADTGLLFNSYKWMIPVDLEEVAAVRIGNVEIPVS